MDTDGARSLKEQTPSRLVAAGETERVINMQFMPTNDVFHHLLLLLRLHKDKDLIVELFASEGITVSKSQIKGWQTKTGKQHPGYREMPREMLDAFISALHERALIEDE